MNKNNGNALFIIMLAVALFAALTMVVSGMSDSEMKGTSAEQTKLRVNEVLQYAAALKAGVDRVYIQNGVSESDIRFAHPDLHADYGDPDALSPSQMVFHHQGGGVEYKAPPSGVNDGTDWFFAMAACVPQIGTGSANNCSSSGSDDSTIELMAYLPNVSQELCIAINNKLGVTNPSGVPPQDANNAYDITADHYDGSTIYSTNLWDSSGYLTAKPMGCFEGGGTPAASTYHFYAVLLAR